MAQSSMTSREAFRLALCLLAGLLPLIVVHLAYAINLQAGLPGCNPYWDGCLSISRAVRSGPGLAWFKAAALPIAFAMAGTFLGWPRPPATRWVAGAGVVGALSFLVYAFALGTEGEVYRWMRRYGVVLYFAGVGLAQLLLARGLSRRPGGTPMPQRSYELLLVLTWGVGVASALKRRVVEDPVVVDRLENVFEWWFALGLSLLFLALALILYADRRHGKSGSRGLN